MVVSHEVAVLLSFRRAVSFSLSADSNIMSTFPSCTVFPQFRVKSAAANRNFKCTFLAMHLYMKSGHIWAAFVDICLYIEI